jgi:hypothetical protein
MEGFGLFSRYKKMKGLLALSFFIDHYNTVKSLGNLFKIS